METQKLTKQEIFNIVYINLIKQGKPSIDALGDCLYRGPDGTKCAIGWLISDKEYDYAMENKSVKNLHSKKLLPKRFLDFISFLADLQSAHDCYIHQDLSWDNYIHAKLKKIAICYNLTVPEVP